MNTKYPVFTKQIEKRRKIKENREIYRVTITLAMAVLADRFDFEEEDLQAFMDDCNTLMDSLTDKNDTYKEIARNLKEIYGLSVEVTD